MQPYKMQLGTTHSKQEGICDSLSLSLSLSLDPTLTKSLTCNISCFCAHKRKRDVGYHATLLHSISCYQLVPFQEVTRLNYTLSLQTLNYENLHISPQHGSLRRAKHVSRLKHKLLSFRLRGSFA